MLLEPEKAGPLRLVRVVVYTRELRLSEFIRSPYHRLSDTLNQYVSYTLELHDVTTKPLRTDRTARGHLDSAVVSVDEVVPAMPWYTVGIERSPGEQALVRRPERVEALVDADPFAIRGTLHVNPGTSLDQHVRNARRLFLPMTHATGLFSQLPRPISFRAPVLLMNRQHTPRILGRFGQAQNYLAVEGQREVVPQAARILRRTVILRGVPSTAT